MADWRQAQEQAKQKQVRRRAATSAYSGGLERVVHDVEALSEALVRERLAVHADTLAHFDQMRRPAEVGVGRHKYKETNACKLMCL